MKTCFLLIFFLTIPSFSFCAEWYNNPQYLTRIPKSNLGEIIKTRPGSGNMLPTVVSFASNNSPTVDIAAGLLSYPLYAYSPLAGMAGQYVLGKGLQAAVDLVERYNDGTIQTNSSLNDLINDEFQGTTDPAPGDTFFPSTLPDVPSDVCSTYSSQGKTFTVTSGPTVQNVAANCPVPSPGATCALTTIVYFYDYGWSGGATSCRKKTWNGTWQQSQTSWPSGIPQQLTPTLASQLAQRIADEIAANNQTIKDAIKNLLLDNPHLVPDPQPITNYDIQNTTNQTTNEARQEYIDNLTNQYNTAITNNNTELAAELEQKIQEQQIAQQKEQAEQDKETFSPLSDNPFENPYNPGPFDIPIRFARFLDNVKSSGLFSFSSSFFDSLPGGGSPIYTVEAGTYGTHTVDLSETLSTGLAVLKTVLLLLFGFLSIRVVILKR